MAYAALLSLTQTLEQILHSRRQSWVFHEERQIKSLHEKLRFLLSFLEDSSHKKTETITCLEGRIRDATYEAEDIIESQMSKQILSESACCGVISCFWEIIAALQIMIPVFHNYERCIEFMLHNFKEKYEDLQKVIEYIGSISEEVGKMKGMDDIEGSSKSSSSNKRAMVGSDDDLMQIKDPLTRPPSKLKSISIVGIEGIEEVVKMKDRNDVEDLQPMNLLPATSSKSASTNKSAMVGFDDDLLQVKERLIGPSSKLKIISIVGMGGIGKTTLAGNVYNDAYIVHHFYIRAWTTVSQKYDVHALLARLLNSMTDLSHELHLKETEELKKKLYQTLKGNRYLIVMDDVWDINAWEEFQMLFPDDNNGSRIILTTRLSDVAVYANSSSPIHRLNFLSLDQSWNLLCQKVFGEECCPPELEEIGKRIAEKCKGLALALVVISGLLRKAKNTRAYWEYVAENVKSAITRNYDDFMEILSWSYDHLPYHLRACFLYMGVFPEDHVIHVSHLIKLWVAEGFLKPITSKSLEEVGKEYLKDLIDRNLILVRDRSFSNEIKTCSIHDLMRDLCTRKAQEEKFLHVLNQEFESSPEIIKNQRHLSIHRRMQYDVADINDSTVRSLLYFTNQQLSSILCFQLLRVLDACNITFNEFPIEIVKLVSLRYIALIYTGKSMLPASISKLCNLQTLIVFRRPWTDERRILYLPSEILKMPRLRHLLFEQGFLPYASGAQNGNLQTLSGLIDFRCAKEVLQIIPNLKTLGITYYYDSPTVWSFYCLENLVHLHQFCLRYCHSLKCIPYQIGEITTLQVIVLYGCGSSAVTSANLIRQEQEDLGNYGLQVHVYSKENGRKGSGGISFRKMYKSDLLDPENIASLRGYSPAVQRILAARKRVSGKS
ncbi:putative disease resistance RPP13-like protein 3 [Forsythia ovata]|uniref:Disease resistance RPP13-like protein 3 n=1 Tax=Forsythia ovata TaxID=205694 RepID=A0ABD1WU45_9LAMI